jgi:hypothetical protein
MRANKFASIILSSGILYFVSLLIYGCYRIVHYGLNKYYLLIVIVASVGIIICALAFRLRPDYKVNLVLMGLSTVIGIYWVEIFLFLTEPDINIQRRVKQANKIGIAFDIRTIEQVLNELKNNGVKVVPFSLVHPSLFKKGKIYPLGGISNVTTVLCNESGEWTIYDSDEHGFNNSKGVFANEETDIVIVGDSFTHGYCVKRVENIAGQLQTLSEMSVVNLGVGGHGPLRELAKLKEYGELLKPKYTFWLYYEGNDLKDLAFEKQSPILLKYLDSNFSQLLANRQSEIDNLLINRMNQEKNKSGIILENVKSIFKLTQLRYRFNLFNPPPQPSSLFRRILEQARNITTSWNGKLYFVYLPNWKRYTTQVDHHTFYHRDEVLSIVSSLNIPIIDIHEEVFAKHSDPLSLFPFRVHGHYTAEGYRLVSQAIYQHLQKEMPK